MKTAHFFFAVSLGGALVGAWGGATSNTGGTGPDSGLAYTDGSSGGSGSGGSSSGGGSSGASSGATGGEGGMFGCQCAASQTCCVGGPGFGRTFSCASTCAAGALAVACTSAQGCGMGQQCCYLLSGNAPSMTSVSAGMTTCPAGARQTCTTDATCPPGSICQQQSGGAYGFMTCRVTPPCMGTMDCAMGQVCCAGAAGAANACQTATACPSGTTQICSPPTDCGTGTVCCQGGGQTCQVQSACGARGNRQICATGADCPAAYPACQNMTCRASPDAGTPVDSGAPADAPTGG